MNFVALDTEGECFEDGCVFPRLVCSSETIGGAPPTLHPRNAIAPRLAMHLSLGRTIICHNAAHDMGSIIEEDFVLFGGKFDLLRMVWDAYRAGRIRCTQIRERLIDIAKGELRSQKGYYTLQQIAERRIGRRIEKEDTWRLRYGLLADVPLDQWPQDAIDYSLTDADVTYSVFWAQAKEWEGSPEPHLCVPAHRDEEAFQAELDFVLRLMRAWGVRADAARAEELGRELAEKRDQYQADLLEAGLLKPKFKGRGSAKHIVGYSRDMGSIRQQVMLAYNRLGEPVPSTGPSAKHPNGQIQTSREVMEDADDELLLKCADRDRFAKILQFIPVLQRGATVPYNPGWKVLKSTGRTACGSDDDEAGTDPGNLQQPPRDFNVREIIRPREGWWFAGADLPGAELRGLAQMCWDWFGVSRMREVLNSGRDLHTELAATILGKTYEETEAGIKEEKARAKEAKARGEILEAGPCTKAREGAKNCNFGLGGGMGAERFVKTLRKKNIRYTVEQAEFLIRTWLDTWPEMRLYFERATRIANVGYDQAYKSGRVQGGLRFTTAANGPFQRLISDWAKDWLREVSRECYLPPPSGTDGIGTSPLLGSRPVLFLHDETIIETPAIQPNAGRAARRLAKLAEETAKRWIPDVATGEIDCYLSERWYKQADMVLDPEGNVTVWRPAA